MRPTSRASTSRMAEQPSLREKINLKSEYFNLIDDINAVVLDAGSNVGQAAKKITKIVEKADKLFDKVRDTSEMFLDAKVMNTASVALEATASNLDVGEGKFNLFTFADQFKIKATTRDIESPFEALASVAPPVVCNTIPRWSPLLGSFEFTATASTSPMKKARQVRPRDAEAAKKEPEKVVHLDKNRKRAEEIVQIIFSKLKKHYRQNKQKPINYFKFVLNPNSFAATVENIFYVSFLVNDGHVQLEVEEDELFISPCVTGKENSNPQSQDDSLPREKKQNIVSIDMQTWKDLTAALHIKEAMISL